MSKKVVILIDGQNLFYGLKPLGLQERDIKWTDLFKSMLEANDELIRAYWFRPQRLSDGHFTPESIRNQIVYRNYNGCYGDYKSGNHSAINASTLNKIENDARQVEQWLQAQKTRFSNIEYNYDQLCLDNSDIEIVKKGIVKVNPYLQEYNGEKGVDIALAVKMISLSVENKCNKIILISGDYDYAEAINYVKNNMTKVHIVKLHKGFPPKNKSMSRDLSVLADKVIDLYEADIRSNYLK
ncbi:MAG: NYN domain-containing protein [Agriterribacter sp.]